MEDGQAKVAAVGARRPELEDAEAGQRVDDVDHVGDGAVNDDADDDIADADVQQEDIADADVDAFLRALANYLPDIPKADRKPVTQADLDKVGKDLIEAFKGHAIHIIRKYNVNVNCIIMYVKKNSIFFSSNRIFSLLHTWLQNYNLFFNSVNNMAT